MTTTKQSSRRPLLTLEQFKADYQHMTVRYSDKAIRNRVAHRMVDMYYSHVGPECRAWLDQREK